MASTSARLKRMAADCSMAARVWERSACSRAVERLHDGCVDGDRRDDRALRVAHRRDARHPDAEVVGVQDVGQRALPGEHAGQLVFGQPGVAAVGDLVFGLAGVQDGDALVADHGEARDEAQRRVAVAERAQRGSPSRWYSGRVSSARLRSRAWAAGRSAGRPAGPAWRPQVRRRRRCRRTRRKAATISGSNCAPAQRRSSARHWR